MNPHAPRRTRPDAPNSPRVAVIGSGYVGTVVAASLAWLGRTVTAVEADTGKLAALRDGHVPFFEPRLDVLLSQARATGKLTFTSETSLAMECSEVVFLCVGTPMSRDGHADVAGVEAAVLAVAAHTLRRHVLVTKSTVPVGTGGRLEQLVAAAYGPQVASLLPTVSCPEFLREGCAVQDFLHPDRIVVGGEDPAAVGQVVEVFQPLLEQDFLGGRPDRRPALVTTDRASAETAKYAANAFLATKVSFMNEVASICEAVGADVTSVGRAIGLDTRIGLTFLSAGAGWGGSCFGKDLSELIATATDHELSAPLLRATVEVNRAQRRMVVDKVRDRLGSLEGRRICLLGLSFKPETDDLRDAPAIDIAALCIAEGADVVAHDPVVDHVPGIPELTVAPSALEAMSGADAVVIVTDWPEYFDLDWNAARSVMSGDALVDGRNILDPAVMGCLGFAYAGVGRGGQPARPEPDTDVGAADAAGSY